MIRAFLIGPSVIFARQAHSEFLSNVDCNILKYPKNNYYSFFFLQTRWKFVKLRGMLLRKVCSEIVVGFVLTRAKREWKTAAGGGCSSAFGFSAFEAETLENAYTYAGKRTRTPLGRSNYSENCPPAARCRKTMQTTRHQTARQRKTNVCVW